LVRVECGGGDRRDELWIESKVREYIDIAKQPFNTISIDEESRVTLALKDGVSRPIKGIVEYDGPLPTTSIDTVTKRKILSGRVDTCLWEGRVCVYKCIDFSEDIERMQREIRTREVIREKSGNDQVGIAPILAVVVHPSTQFLDGILLPLYPSTLESLTKDNNSTISVESLHGLVKTLAELHDLGIAHGDICQRNIAVNNTVPESDSIGHCDLVFLDFGEIAPRYEGDVKTMGKLLFWCGEHFGWTDGERQMIKNGASALSQEDLGLCLRIFNSMSNP
jgi:serine/threonine protein kinase